MPPTRKPLITPSQSATPSSVGSIVVASRRVASRVTEISAASAEQSFGIEEMSQTVAHMDETTQQNAGLAEQSARLAATLSRQIDELEALVTSFKTERDAS